MRIYLTLVLLFIYYLPAKGQRNTPPCGFGKMQQLRGYVPANSLNKTDAADDSSTFIIPTVVHIIHNNGPENIPDKVVYDQIAVLNEDFGKYGGGSNPYVFSSDTRIRFCLATTDPQGNPSTGIEHIRSSLTNTQSSNEVALKNLSRWDPSRYLNIWVVKSIDGTYQTAGYSYLAEAIYNNKDSGKYLDGIVMNYHYFGRHETTNFAGSDLGHSTTHEAGHYFNLLHTWGGDGPHEGGCNDDDKVDDTPDCDGVYYSRYLSRYDSCEDPVQCGHLRLIQDYMDYSEDRCLNTFTNGQKYRMRQAILTYRTGLIAYGNATTTGCQDVFRQYNPATDIILISPSLSGHSIRLFPYLPAATDGVFFLFDASGKLIYRTELHSIQHNEIELDGIPFSKGLYIAVVMTSSKRYVQKIVGYW